MFSFGFNIDSKISGGVSYDADAAAFFTAASITDTTQKNAVNQLVLDLKSYNIWNKMIALYPIVGGSAGSHAVNLKTPGTYNLTFSTGWTHASTGMIPTSAFANIGLNTSTIGLNSGHLSFYSRTNTSTNCTEMGSLKSGTPNSYTDLGIRQGASGAYVRYNNNGTPTYVVNSDAKGFYIGSRTANNAISLYKNGSSIQSLTTGVGGTTTVNIYIGAQNNNGTGANYTDRECAFSSIGTGLDATESANFNTAVQAYQTTLSRNV